MAEFNSYLLGRVRKSVGNLTMVYTKSKNIVRSKVFGRKDNPTPEVLMQREKVKLLGQLGRKILPVIRKGFVGIGKGSAFNAFIAANLPHVTVDEKIVGSIDYEHLLVATGLLYTPQVKVTYDEASGSYHFSQSVGETEEGFAGMDDNVYGVLLETDLQRTRLIELQTRGTAGETDVQIPQEWKAEHIKIYSFALTKNGKMASDSIFLSV